MSNLTKQFIQAQSAFQKSQSSQESVEDLFDLLYHLQGKERSFNDHYILAQVHLLLHQFTEAKQIIQQSLQTASKSEAKKLNQLQKNIPAPPYWNQKSFRDLRSSRIKKQSTTLSNNDFFIHELEGEPSVQIKLLNTNSIVIANKILSNEGDQITILAPKENPKDHYDKIGKYIKWLGELHSGLIQFYRHSSFPLKQANVSEEWYDALSVSELTIEIDEDGCFHTEIIFADYTQNDLGFYLRLEDQTLISIQYDPIL